MKTFSKLDERTSKRLLEIARSPGFLDFGEADVKRLSETRERMYAQLAKALHPDARVTRIPESYGEEATVHIGGQLLGYVTPNATNGTMDFTAKLGKSVRLTSPATAKRLIESIV